MYRCNWCPHSPDTEGGLIQGQPGPHRDAIKIREKKKASSPHAGGGDEETSDFKG